MACIQQKICKSTKLASPLRCNRFITVPIFRSSSTQLPVITSMSMYHNSPPEYLYQVLDIIPTPITSPLTSNQITLSESSFMSDRIKQIQWNVSTPLSPNNQPFSTSATSPTCINEITEYIPRPPTQNVAAGCTQRTGSLLTLAPSNMEAKLRRRTQNREAQRKFRERKENHLKTLEEKAKRLVEVEKRCEELERENQVLKLRLQELERNMS
ncbi:hypothetical protein BKA69DRAFT_1079967 [Paraphysoderma sedebokerense]|nr:hypothetical protein BKA69DRAFT_1079967 [Paraphysoderma sedebokerense]